MYATGHTVTQIHHSMIWSAAELILFTQICATPPKMADAINRTNFYYRSVSGPCSDFPLIVISDNRQACGYNVTYCKYDTAILIDTFFSNHGVIMSESKNV